jgi:hypothetical protein
VNTILTIAVATGTFTSKVTLEIVKYRLIDLFMKENTVILALWLFSGVVKTWQCVPRVRYDLLAYATTAYHTTVSSALVVNRMQSNIHLFHSLTFCQLKSEFGSDSPNNLKEVHLYPEIPAASFILLDLYTYWTILFGPISC